MHAYRLNWKFAQLGPRTFLRILKGSPPQAHLSQNNRQSLMNDDWLFFLEGRTSSGAAILGIAFPRCRRRAAVFNDINNSRVSCQTWRPNVTFLRRIFRVRFAAASSAILSYFLVVTAAAESASKTTGRSRGLESVRFAERCPLTNLPSTWFWETSARRFWITRGIWRSAAKFIRRNWACCVVMMDSSCASFAETQKSTETTRVVPFVRSRRKRRYACLYSLT